MINKRSEFGCGIYHSSVHLGRPVIAAAGGMDVGIGDTGPGSYEWAALTSEIWDFTLPGSQWQSSEYLVKIDCKCSR